ncbi:MAG: acyl-CoA/acyl-ACP dehydrogenase [Myxococcales bacterium]|nr:acyl-CoA/acyl-ACP dehydrogenase [Myxococcales bacterium]
MMLPEIEVGLTEEELAIRDTVHKFAAEVMRPVGERLDRLPDPADVIAEGSELWAVFEQYRALGIGLDAMDDSDLDPLRRARIRALINEEMGWGDGGLAISLSVAEFHRVFARLSGNPELIERFCKTNSTEIGCWAITEPSHGSDMLKNDPKDFQPPARKPDCIAERDGDDFIINGQKSAWVSNGTIADVGVLFCSLMEGDELKGGCVGVVPFDLPGVSKGKPLDKLGQRALNQGEIFFDNVRVPASYLFIGPEMYVPIVEIVLSGANGTMGTIWAGCARAALEHAIDYSKERIQGGIPIGQHPHMQARLFKMLTKVEAARSLVRRVSYFNGLGEGQMHYAIASKVFATQTAFEVASEALQIFGGNGLTREYPMEKLLRDARSAMIEDGCNELLCTLGGSKL